jgi:hypothetical protein
MNDFTFHVDDDSISNLTWGDAVDLAAATPFAAITKGDLTFALTDARGFFHLLTPPVVTSPSFADLMVAA